MMPTSSGAPFPDVDAGRWQVSVDVGCDARWNRSGRELFFNTECGGTVPPHYLMSVAVRAGASFDFDRPKPLFESSPYYFNATTYDVSPDGNRFLMVKTAPAPRPSITVVTHWFDELKRLVPVK